jgi:hypothetical protein
VRGAALQEFPLTQGDLTADIQNRLLPLLDAFNEKIPAPYFVAQVFPDFF